MVLPDDETVPVAEELIPVKLVAAVLPAPTFIELVVTVLPIKLFEIL